MGSISLFASFGVKDCEVERVSEDRGRTESIADTKKIEEDLSEKSEEDARD